MIVAAISWRIFQPHSPVLGRNDIFTGTGGLPAANIRRSRALTRK